MLRPGVSRASIWPRAQPVPTRLAHCPCSQALRAQGHIAPGSPLGGSFRGGQGSGPPTPTPSPPTRETQCQVQHCVPRFCCLLSRTHPKVHQPVQNVLDSQRGRSRALAPGIPGLGRPVGGAELEQSKVRGGEAEPSGSLGFGGPRGLARYRRLVSAVGGAGRGDARRSLRWLSGFVPNYTLRDACLDHCPCHAEAEDTRTRQVEASGSHRRPPRGCGPGVCGVLRNQAPGEALPRAKAKPLTR